MPSFDEHAQKAIENYNFLETFLFEKSHDWAITVMFYTIVHCAEAMIFSEVNKLKADGKRGYYSIHSKTHDERTRYIKDLFPSLHESHTELQKGAHDGRYKAYRYSLQTLFFNYDNYFLEAINFFNEYCKVLEKPFFINTKKYNFTEKHLKNKEKPELIK